MKLTHRLYIVQILSESKFEKHLLGIVVATCPDQAREKAVAMWERAGHSIILAFDELIDVSLHPIEITRKGG